MKKSLATIIMATFFIAMAYNSGNAAADPPQTEGNLTIIGYYGDVFHEDDHKTLTVTESIFYNNSGTERFSGNVTLMLQDGATTTTRLCGSQENRIARVEMNQRISCFAMQPTNVTTYTFKPFNTGEFLSFYGEQSTIGLNMSSSNGTAQVDFNATLGVSSRPSQEIVTLGNITINITQTELGAQAFLMWGPPRNLTISQTVNISNSGNVSEVVDLGLQNTPPGWATKTLSDGANVSSISVPPKSFVNIVLEITAPSYILHMYVEYVITGEGSESSDSIVTLEKVFPYNTSFAEIYLYAFERNEVTTTQDFQIHGNTRWNSTTRTYIYTIIGIDIRAGDASTVTVKWTPPPFTIPLWAIVLLAVIASILIAFPIYRKWRGEKEEEEVAVETEISDVKKPPINLAELRGKRDTLKKSLERLEAEEKEGTVPKDIVIEMKQEIQTELTEVESQLGSLSSATARKKAILKALRKLERDYKEGKVDKAVYASLKARYEREAVNVLKKIDELKTIEGGNGDTNE